MPQSPPAPIDRDRPTGRELLVHPGATLILIGVVTFLRIAYLAWGCPYTLIEDEAHYWEWSRRLDWSYYSKGPGVAWSIAVSTALFGDTEFGVRLPAVVFAAVGALGLAALTRDVFDDRRAPFFAAAGSLLIPAFQFGGVLLTVDMPYAAAWAWAGAAAWRALAKGSGWAWPALGASLGAGFLFKYTILLLIPGLLIFAWLARGRLRTADRAPAWMLAGVGAFALAAAPILIWNAANGWPTLHHLLGHVGAPGGDMPGAGAPDWRPLTWSGEFLATQAALIGPMIVVMGLSIARWRSAGSDDRGLFLVGQAAPILAGYAVLNLVTRVEGNWPLAGYVPLAALAGWAVAETAGTAARTRYAVNGAWRAAVVLGVVTALAPLRLDWVAASPPVRWLESALRAVAVLDADRRLVPAGRLWGAREMAADVHAIADRLGRETGLAPLIVAEHYGRAGLLAFYLPGHPVVYCSSSRDGEGRRTQYDYWPDTDLDDMPQLAGRPGVLLGSKLDRWSAAFDRVEDLGRLPHETKRDRRVFAGYGFRGFPDSQAGPGRAGASPAMMPSPSARAGSDR